MPRRFARRLSTALVVVLSLLFAQLALANYVCPPGSSRPVAMMDMPSGEPCDGMAPDHGQAMLCFQHCTQAPQSFDAVKLPSVSLPAVVQELAVPLAMDAARQHAHASGASGDAQPPPEPVFLSTLRLRV